MKSRIDGIRDKINTAYELVAKELPTPTHQVGGAIDTMVEMEDGARLMTRTILPEGEGPWPVIALRDPYSPVDKEESMFLGILVLVLFGYAVSYQQVRGLYHSEGEWRAFENEREDGLCFLRWVARQPWCDGRIGTYGGSYLGHVQWTLADVFPPEVKTMYALVWGDDPYISFYENGMFKEGTWTLWAAQMMHPGDRENLSIPDMSGYEKLLNCPSQLEADLLLRGSPCAWYRSWIQNTCRDDSYWRESFWSCYKGLAEKVSVPVLLQTGWFDIFLEPTLLAFSHLNPDTRSQSRLIIGPWHHGNAPGGVLEYPNEDRFGVLQIKLALEWFDAKLKKISEIDGCGCTDAYVIGEGRWKRFEGCFCSQKTRRFYLCKGLNTAGNRLSAVPPLEHGTVSYRYDPADPVPTQGGKLLMNYREGKPEPECVVEQPPIGWRKDVISFVSPVLEDGLAICGKTAVHLFASSDAEDTAFTAKLCEIFPDGRTVNICDGICTLLHRISDAVRVPYVPGSQVILSFSLPPAAWTLQKGSCLRLDISSSNFPAFHRHPNKAGCWASIDTSRAAMQTLVLNGESWIDISEVSL